MKVLAIVGVFACLASVPALATCVEPINSPTLPDGSTASREQMLAAQNALKAYDAAVKVFADCVHKNGENAMRADRAADKLSSFADKFNAELRAFKKKASGA